MFTGIKAYLKFIFTSTNQHGVHSPFVYDLVTKCFYTTTPSEVTKKLRPLLQKNKYKNITYHSAKLLHRTITYFKHRDILVLNSHPDFICNVLSINHKVTIHTNPLSKDNFDIIYTDLDDSNSMFDIATLLKKMHNNSIMIFNKIHASQSTITLWQNIKNHPDVSVTIDTFFLGFVFIRKEQVKENFIIRT